MRLSITDRRVQNDTYLVRKYSAFYREVDFLFSDGRKLENYEIDFVQSRKGNLLLRVNGFHYCQDKRNVKIWRCTMKNQCRARVVKKEFNLYEYNEHIHDPPNYAPVCIGSM